MFRCKLRIAKIAQLPCCAGWKINHARWRICSFHIYYLGHNATSVTTVVVRWQILIKIFTVRAIELLINLGKHNSWNCISISIKKFYLFYSLFYYSIIIYILFQWICITRGRCCFTSSAVKLSYGLGMQIITSIKYSFILRRIIRLIATCKN